MSDYEKPDTSTSRRATSGAGTSNPSTSKGSASKGRTSSSSGSKGLSRPVYALIGLLVGLLLGIVLIWVLQGNPFSSANQVVYTDVVVASVTEEEDGICWAQDPGRRDSPQQCAILSLDPELPVPDAGDVVTIGMVEIRTPDGDESQQVVHVAPAEGEDVDLDESPTPSTQDEG